MVRTELKTLFFITKTYPFGRGETFIENEIEFLAGAFDKIIIVSENHQDEQSREVPDNVRVFRYVKDAPAIAKLKSLTYVFSGAFVREMRQARQKYGISLSIGIVKSILASLQNGNKFYSFLKKIIHNNAHGGIYVYSYWLTEYAYAVAELKQEYPAFLAFARAHGWDLYFERSIYNYLPFKYFDVENLDGIFFISDHGRRYFQSKLGLGQGLEKKLKTTRLGINNSMHGHKSTIFPDKLNLVSCAMIDPNKRVDMIVHALSLLPEDVKVSWKHIGIGYQKEEEFKIKALAKDLLNNKSNIEYEFAGYMNNDEVLRYYHENNFDLLINTSKSEGLPVSFMEAMSCGIPVIAPEVGGIPEIVNDENGILLPPNPSAREIAFQLQAFYFQKDAIKLRYRQKAHEMWESNYSARRNFQYFIRQVLELGQKEM